MNFDEMILEAAKSIANATSHLIKAASEAQKELVAQGKVSKKTHIGSEDGKQTPKPRRFFFFASKTTNDLFFCDSYKYRCIKLVTLGNP